MAEEDTEPLEVPLVQFGEHLGVDRVVAELLLVALEP